MSLPYRQIHLDFHTSECIEGIGAAFSRENFKEWKIICCPIPTMMLKRLSLRRKHISVCVPVNSMIGASSKWRRLLMFG